VVYSTIVSIMCAPKSDGSAALPSASKMNTARPDQLGAKSGRAADRPWLPAAGRVGHSRAEGQGQPAAASANRRRPVAIISVHSFADGNSCSSPGS
jgi:hypothetical protein